MSTIGRVPPASPMDPRTPRPDPRSQVVVAVAGAAVAVSVYLVALAADLLPPESLSVAMFVVTPVFAALALVVLHARRHESTDPDLTWFVAGLAVAVAAMVAQVISFPAVTGGGGPFQTDQDSNGALYLAFHLFPALGALAGAGRWPSRWRPWFVAAGAVVVLALALDLVPLPELITPTGQFTSVLIATELVVAVVVAAASVAWFVRSGAWARPLVAWVGVAQTLAVYDLLLNAAGGARFTEVWWASLSMRVATYGFLAVASILTVLTQSRVWERYTSAELDRREGQLRQSLDSVSTLLAQTSRDSLALREHLLPPALPSPAGVDLEARYAGAGADKRVGGDWYDVVPLGAGGLALVIGDVEGHDLAAAAVMGQVRAAVSSYALEGHPPAVLLDRVNRFLLNSGLTQLVGLAYVQLHPDDRLVTVAVAGNPPPLLVPHDGAPATAVPVEVGPPLGIDEHQQWPERTLLLPQRCDLAVFTDGVLARIPWGGLGDPFPSRLLPQGGGGWTPTDLADALMGAVADDDAAALVARISSRVHTSAARTLPARPISAPIARSWLSDLGKVWVSSGDLADSTRLGDRLDTAALLLSELVSNAVRHGEDDIHLCVTLEETCLRVDVTDSSHRMPALGSPARTDTSGRGLRLVEALSDDWGVEPLEQGKSVWFTLDLDVDPPDEDQLIAIFALDDV